MWNLLLNSKQQKKLEFTVLVFKEMTIYLYGEVQPQRKCRHFVMRAH